METIQIFEESMHVPLFECDFTRCWKPAAVLQHLMELGTHHAETLGWGYDAMLAHGLFWVNARVKIRFFKYPHAGDAVRLRTWPKTIQQKIFFVRDFELENERGERLAATTCAFVAVNANTRRMSPLGALNIHLPSLPQRNALDETLEKITPLVEINERLRVRAAYSVLDVLGHVNNSRYVEWLCDAFPVKQYQEKQVAWLQVNYEREILPGEQTLILTGKYAGDDDVWYAQGIKEQEGARAFEAALGWETKRA